MKYALAIILSLVSLPAFAAVNMSISGLVEFVVYLLIVGIIFGGLLWLVGKAPFIPDAGKQVITWIIYLVGALMIINLLLGLIGQPMFTLR